MRWGLIPRWWSKTIKHVKMATFNARAETVEAKPFFRDDTTRDAHSSHSIGVYSDYDG